VAKVKSRISVSRHSNGVTIRATGSFAMDLVAALSGKTVEQLKQRPDAAVAETPAPPETKVP